MGELRERDEAAGCAVQAPVLEGRLRWVRVRDRVEGGVLVVLLGWPLKFDVRGYDGRREQGNRDGPHDVRERQQGVGAAT